MSAETITIINTELSVVQGSTVEVVEVPNETVVIQTATTGP